MHTNHFDQPEELTARTPEYWIFARVSRQSKYKTEIADMQVSTGNK